MIIEASAPSNIALIKYMGKISTANNQPTNSSLSWTLKDLRTHVRMTLREDLTSDQWQPLVGQGLAPLELSAKSRDRYLAHLSFLKKKWGIESHFLVESANNFPADCGLASSASSFAALTKAASLLFQEMAPKSEFNVMEMADLSRQGSGSSCRSFFEPWALWYNEGVRPLEFHDNHLFHQVVVVESAKKEVSSSEAHRRVASSSLFQNRPQRAERRLAMLMQALSAGEWKDAYEITWAEFWDMHALFETSEPHFSYMHPRSLLLLRQIEHLWNEVKDGPLITMDAGANIHLLWRNNQKSQAQKFASDFGTEYSIFSSQELRS